MTIAMKKKVGYSLPLLLVSLVVVSAVFPTLGLLPTLCLFAYSLAIFGAGVVWIVMVNKDEGDGEEADADFMRALFCTIIGLVPVALGSAGMYYSHDVAQGLTNAVVAIPEALKNAPDALGEAWSFVTGFFHHAFHGSPG